MKLYINNFNVRISENLGKDYSFKLGTTLLELFADTNIIKFNPTVIIADPFLFVNNGELFLFYEKQNKWYGKGHICMRKTKDLIDWSEEKVVLNEPFHLSFPFVFSYGGKVYMIPETGQDGSVRLYESLDTSLERWQLRTKLLDDGYDWVDSSIVEDKGMFFLFSSKKSDNEPYKQCLFFSKSITGPFIEHPKSPIYIGNDYGRNSGSVFKYGDKWMRPTQDCSVGYGDNVSFFCIETLTKNDFAETLFIKNIFKRVGIYKEGGHQFNFVEFNGRFIVATDFKKKNYNVIELIRRIIKKIKK